MKNKKQTKEKYNKLRGRKTALDRRFQFTPENIKKIEEFNAALLRKSHELFDKITRQKEELDALLKFRSAFPKVKPLCFSGGLGLWEENSYTITGELFIKSKRKELADIVRLQAPYTIIASSTEPEFDRVSALMEDMNWDIENLHPLNGRAIHICYATHHFFTDGLFALSDIALLSENDISLSVSLNS